MSETSPHPFLCPFSQRLMLTAGCWGTTQRDCIPPPGAFIHSSLVLTRVRQCLGHCTPAQVCSGSLGVTVWAAGCLWLSAGLYGQGALGCMDREHWAPRLWLVLLRGGGGAAVLVDLTCVCYVTPALQEQDSKSNSPSGPPETSLRAKTPGALSCSLKDSTSVSFSNVCMWKPQSAETCSLHTCFMMNLFSQARWRFRNVWSTREGLPWGWVHVRWV